ncbi:MAG: hypothetical protein WCP69_12010 [Bacteroidota bacterium]
MNNIKYIFLIIILLAFSVKITVAQNVNRRVNKNIDSRKKIAQLKENPITNFRAAYWFAKLSFKQKQYFSKKLGTIVLTSSDSTEFIVAFGAEKSPYPWAFQVNNANIKLYTKNNFVNIFRNDKYVQNQWGVYWTSQPYITKIKLNNRNSLFIQNSDPRNVNLDLWIPATGWKYVGPELEISKDTLKSNLNNINVNE